MASDPLLGLVSRALGVAVERIAVERIRASPLAEVDRIRWRGPAGEGSLLFKRMHRLAGVEAGLLPALARRGSPVEAVLASGIPPRHAPEPRPWVLVREAEGIPLCAGGERVIETAASALRSLHEGTKDELSLLRALGLPELAPGAIVEEALAATSLLESADARRLSALAGELDLEALAAAGTSLVHGDLVCERVLARDGDVVFLDWARAHLGSPLEDVGALSRSLRRRDVALAGRWGAAYPLDDTTLMHAERLHLLAAIRWQAWEGREGIRPLGESAAEIARALG